MYYRLEIWYIDLNHKIKPGDICHVWAVTIPRMFTHHPKDGQPPSKNKSYIPDLKPISNIWNHLEQPVKMHSKHFELFKTVVTCSNPISKCFELFKTCATHKKHIKNRFEMF